MFAMGYEAGCVPSLSDFHYPKASTGVERTFQPIVTGTSVIAVKYADGVMMAADTLGSYGSLARFKDISRMFKVGKNTIVGVSGDISDMQQTQISLDIINIMNQHPVPYCEFSAKNIHCYLSRYMYEHRTSFDPRLNSIVVAGMQNESFLGFVNHLGVTYTDSAIATGYGAYIATPLLRNAIDKYGETLSEKDAEELILNCMRVLYYRDARSWNTIQISKCTANSCEISDPIKLDTNWEVGRGVSGYGP